jgi:hypothetical protein
MRTVHWVTERRWTLLAGACFLWNSTKNLHGRGYVTDYARRSPWVAYGLLLSLAYHFHPRHQGDR